MSRDVQPVRQRVYVISCYTASLAAVQDDDRVETHSEAKRGESISSFDHRAGLLDSFFFCEKNKGNRVLMCPTLPGCGMLSDFTQILGG